ncbi:MAG: GNAT family N-acetyltransferase [Bacteroides sp.]|nr:GNAT family N-acetyltransferase [Prevotella sp.]MCM1406963.1 GNAT family N-acetyltransferase [Treponema brennaborense]MCM1470114.1 GNAT family N-acetyltransferase [Bacteroides sp.]
MNTEYPVSHEPQKCEHRHSAAESGHAGTQNSQKEPALTAERLCSETLQETVRFLETGEQFCVSLAERLVRGGVPVMPPASYRYWILRRAGNIAGVISISAAGLMQHHLPLLKNHPLAEKMPAETGGRKSAAVMPHENAVRECLAPLFSAEKLYCLMGDAVGNRFIRSICRREPQTIVSFELQSRSTAPSAVFSAENFREKDVKPLPPECSIVRCSIKDADELFPLQKNYDIEEVIPSGSMFSASACLSNLKKQLETQCVFGVKYRDSFIAKAGTNARGFRCDQIGGVFTVPHWRNKGIASVLMQHVVRHIEAQKKQAVLFVKTKNESAKAVYSRIGFRKIGNYEITYF